MKNKQFLWYTFILLLLVFTSCELQDDVEPSPPINQSSKVSAYTSITQEPKLATVLSKIKTRAMRSTHNSNNVEFGDLNIDTDRFLKVLQPNKSFIYTFEIKNSRLKNKYRNLLLKEVNGGFVATIVEYEPDQKSDASEARYESAKFSGVIRRYNLEGKLLKMVTVKNGNQIQPDASVSGVSVNSTATTATTYCVSYVGESIECVPDGLPTESPGAGEGMGGCTWTRVYTFEQVPCDGGGGSYDGGGGSYDGGGGSYDGGGGSFIPSEPINPGDDELIPADGGEVIGVIEPEPLPKPEPLPYIMAGEGAEASDYDDAYWSNPYLVFPAQDVPSYQNFNNVYPRGMSGLAVFKMIGGEPLDIAMKQGKFNACAARVSYALNYSGVTIPHISGQTFKGVDGKYYFIGAKNMENWMIKTFGAPTISVNATQAGLTGEGFINLANGRKGIYFMRPEYDTIFGATGHGDIFDGVGFDKEGYFGNGFYSGNLWVLK